MLGRTSVALMLAVGLVLAACDDGGITGQGLTTASRAQPELGQGAGPHTMVPITWTYHMMPASDDMITCTNSDGSTPFLSFPVYWMATGKMTHLGITDSEASSAWFTACVVNLVDGVPVSADGDGYVHLVGANGDAVDLAGVLSLSFVDFTATGDWTITGGSGRFDGASGWIDTFREFHPERRIRRISSQRPWRPA